MPMASCPKGGSDLIDLHCDTLSKLVNSAYSLARNPFHFDIQRAFKGRIDHSGPGPVQPEA